MNVKSVFSPLSGNKTSYRLTTEDFMVSGEKFDLFYDQEWDMLLTNPIPENLSPYYQSEAYQPHKHHSKSWFDNLYNWVRNNNYKYKYRIIQEFNPKANAVLDYGTATGEFLNFLSKKNMKVSGVEPNEYAREHANTLLNNKVKVSVSDINESFDVITLWHVLEHVSQPHQLITDLKKRLNPHGIILIAVPNFKSYDAQAYGKYWAAYDTPRHLWHFSPKAMKELFSKFEMQVTSIKPLYFDSFYVSLLSEQYKTGRKRLFYAFWNGLLSVIKAKKSGQYSSLIYVLKTNS